MGCSNAVLASTASQPRHFRIAGFLFLGVGILWLALGTLTVAWLFLGTPIKTAGTHGMLPENAFSIVFGFGAALLTAPSVVPIAIGAALRARWQIAPPLALVAAMGGLMAATTMLASTPGPLQPNAAFGLVVSAMGVLLSGAITILLVRGMMALAADSSPPPVVAFFAPLTRQVAVVFVPAFAFAIVSQCAHARTLRDRPDDLGPISLRSDLTLALQATASPSATAERAEVLRRGPSAAKAIADALSNCPPTAREQNHDAGRLASACADWRVPGMMTLLGELGGPDALTELRRWLEWPEADAKLRASAAYALAVAKDTASIGAIALLLDEPDPPYRTVEALALMHAVGETSHLRAAMLRVGPTAAASREGLKALTSFDTDEAWGAWLELGESSDLGWRRLVVGQYAHSGDPSVPARGVALCAERLDDDDRESRGYACLSLMGSDGRSRYPQLYALYPDPCNEFPPRPARIGHIRDAVAGRPLPSPSVPHPRFVRGLPYGGRPRPGAWQPPQ